MKYDCIKEEYSEFFRSLTGVKRTTFDTMIDILKKSEALLFRPKEEAYFKNSSDCGQAKKGCYLHQFYQW